MLSLAKCYKSKIYIFFYMLCLFIKWSIMALLNVLSIVNLIFVSLLSFPASLLANHSQKVVACFTCCFPLLLMPSVCSVNVKFFKVSYLVCVPEISWIQKHPFHFHFLRIFSLLTWSVRGILSILTQNHISVDSGILFIC